jgi:hypothetical protein
MLIDYTEIATLLGVAKRTPEVWRTRHKGFPTPRSQRLRVETVPIPLFDKNEIIEWATLTERWDDVVGMPLINNHSHACACCDTNEREEGRSDYRDTPLQDPANVVRDAGEGWTVWEPGDLTRYHVAIIRFTKGPSAGDKLVVVTTERSTGTFRIGIANLTEPEVKRTVSTTDTQGYDWWPKVLRPLAIALRMKED